MKRSHFVVCIGIAVLGASIFNYSQWGMGDRSDSPLDTSVLKPADSSPVAAHNPVSVSPGTLPSESDASLPALPRDDRVADIDVDGAVRVDMNGNLVLDRDLRRFMDFFIGLAPDRRYEEAMRQRMQAVMTNNGIPFAIQQEVLEILEHYLAYREAATAMEQHGSLDSTNIQATFDALYSLRREHLGADVAEGFYGQEEHRLRLMLDRQRILADDSMSEAERDRALAQLNQLLPDHVRETRETSETVVSMVQKVQKLRASGASEAEVRALRLQHYGAEATARLEGLDQQRQRWQARVNDYEQRKQQVLQSEGLAQKEREEALEALRQEIFQEEHERRRIRALDNTSGSSGLST
ncbi:lipase secretion chaperone [Marinobacter sp. SS5-14b]|uniref:lipase secretion chaperone n=1 Tax=Marinobacter sp. SS5-14b TaxID=3050456 RepID=UPI0026DEB0D9|nr:lipase secretion chaperone [Marinobacter sp. SS5-14b]